MTGPVLPGLAGADGSAASMLAVAWAAAEASRRGIPLAIAHVTGSGPAGRPVAESIVDSARDLARSVAPGLAVRTVVRDGDPVEVLTGLGRTCALLVVGHRGSDEHPGPGPGSTAEAVARAAPVTVAVVGMDEDRFPRERCTGPALPTPSAVRLDRSITGPRPARARVEAP